MAEVGTNIVPPQGQPCNNYRVDLTATGFAICKCGFPRDAHITKEENKAAQALRNLKMKNSQRINVNDVDWSNGEGKACKNYRVDVNAENFGDCVCGFPKDAHVDRGENNAAKALKKLRSTQSAKDNFRPRTGKPCNNYKVDLNAENFGDCLCGFPKEAHIQKEENNAAKLLKKLKEKNELKHQMDDLKAEGRSEEAEELRKAAEAAKKKKTTALANVDSAATPAKSGGCCVIS